MEMQSLLDRSSVAARVDNNYPAMHPGVFARLEYHGHFHEIMKRSITEERQRRQPHDRASEILHDLLASSLVPLTESSTDFAKQAAEFLSCFKDRNVKWGVDVKAVPFRQATAIHGLTANSRNEAIQYRFLRFRFPFVRFEWHVETPHHTVDALLHGIGGPVEVRFLWKAWTRNFAASAVIAFGSCTDTLERIDRNTLVISSRSFVVTKLIQPELMIPVPYPQNVPELAEPRAFSTFSTSQSVIQCLQNSQKWLTFLIAVSALVASVKPFIDGNHAISLVLSAVAISTAAMSILVYVLSLALKRIEGNSAKYHVN